MTQTSIHLTVSPALYGVALNPQEPQQLRSAVRLACRWWGGMRFPWLAVAANGSVTDQAVMLCDELDVIGIIDLTRSIDSEPVSPGIASLGRSIVIGENRPPLAMPVRAVVRPSAERPIVRARDEADPNFDLIAMLNLGIIDEGDCAVWEESGQGIAVGSSDSNLRSQPGPRTALGITTTGDDNFIVTSAFITSAALIWVLPDTFAIADVVKDICAFWNYRALRLRHQSTVTVLTRLQSLNDHEVRRRLVEAISATAVTTPMCVFNGLAVGSVELRRVAETLGFDVLDDDTTITDRHFTRGERIDLTAVVNFNLASHWIGERYTGSSKDALAIARRPSWQARVDSPIQWNYPDALQGVTSIRISAPEIEGPHSDAVAELYQKNAQWRAGGIRIFDRATSIYRRTIGYPEPSEVLQAALANGEARFAVSDKGREIGGILSASLDLKLFRSPAFHAITNILTPRPSPRVQHALEQLAKEITTSPDTVRLADELQQVIALAKPRRFTLKELANHSEVRALRIRYDSVSTVLTEMVARGLAKWGFERQCALCGLTELVPLTSVSPVPLCTGCGRDAAFELRNGEPVIYYGLTSLLERVSRNAGLTPLAAAVALQQTGYYVVAGANIIQGDRSNEADFLGWHQYRLITGEAKAAAALFTVADVTNDIEYASRLGATTYLLACPERLDRQIIEGAVLAGVKYDVEILQLTGADLTSEMPPTFCVSEVPISSG